MTTSRQSRPQRIVPVDDDADEALPPPPQPPVQLRSLVIAVCLAAATILLVTGFTEARHGAADRPVVPGRPVVALTPGVSVYRAVRLELCIDPDAATAELAGIAPSTMPAPPLAAAVEAALELTRWCVANGLVTETQWVTAMRRALSRHLPAVEAAGEGSSLRADALRLGLEVHALYRTLAKAKHGIEHLHVEKAGGESFCTLAKQNGCAAPSDGRAHCELAVAGDFSLDQDMRPYAAPRIRPAPRLASHRLLSSDHRDQACAPDPRPADPPARYRLACHSLHARPARHIMDAVCAHRPLPCSVRPHLMLKRGVTFTSLEKGLAGDGLATWVAHDAASWPL